MLPACREHLYYDCSIINMIVFVRPMIGFDRFAQLDSTHHVRKVMARKDDRSNARDSQKRVSSQQKKLRLQQIFMAVVGIILALTMVLALVANY